MSTTIANATTDHPQTVHFLGSLLTFRARAADTGGTFSIVESCSAPGAGAPPHLQADAEAFLVTEGSFEFMLGETWRRCGPGEFVYVAPGVVHAFRNAASTPSRMLIINLPGGPHENFFKAVGEPVNAEPPVFPPMGAPDVAYLTTEAERFGITILPTPHH
ncbi:cupin domain-containing protein [Rhizobium wuzhouense]|uniref:Cupin domain-containing protein n=1 Tax=Rhizobium wuzhouense TaxID=1986026 RepID=A0ABX5NW05_9HYPH|nr:cupin domain-containing protein [Rhizobium wuzhouense]PYB75324.1 cupin domain-containing protein [Rhizobium wuzhouense]